MENYILEYSIDESDFEYLLEAGAMKGARYGYSAPNTQLFYDNNYKNYYPTEYNIIVTYEDKYRKIPVYCKMELGKFNRAVFSMKVKKASKKIQNAVDRFGDLKHGPSYI